MPISKNAKTVFQKLKQGKQISEEEKLIAFPCLDTKLIPLEQIVYNEYNPNKVAPPEMKLLKTSIEEDGYTQPVVTIYDIENDRYILIDGAHRYKNAIKLKLPFIPSTVINKNIENRMASTIRHNRARGEHNIKQMSNIVAELIILGWDDMQIGKHLGMGADEVLRLKQNMGLPELFKNHQYSPAWE